MTTELDSLKACSQTPSRMIALNMLVIAVSKRGRWKACLMYLHVTWSGPGADFPGVLVSASLISSDEKGYHSLMFLRSSFFRMLRLDLLGCVPAKCWWRVLMASWGGWVGHRCL